MFFKTMEERIYELMEENHIIGRIVDYKLYNGIVGMVAVEIIWGDWKHQHKRFDCLMRKSFRHLRRVHEVITEECECDFYSAVHYYYFD